MNLVMLTGRLTADPQINTYSGNTVANFTLAVSNGKKDESGNYLSDFYRCSVWGNASQRAQRLTKGTFCAVAGYLSTSQYVSQSGKDRTDLNVSVVSLDFPPVKVSAPSDDFMSDLD